MGNEGEPLSGEELEKIIGSETAKGEQDGDAQVIDLVDAAKRIDDGEILDGPESEELAA
ncbi:hypothetical protein HOF40_03590 [Candidatus Parcubacteria bacterium]|jgi:hypothetical protein|nr:hypothetical protein [Candidatus Parcubacteria bacterium]MBT3949144.1 hypothetical protein [Candidatus Parcubacteria bacterium]